MAENQDYWNKKAKEHVQNSTNYEARAKDYRNQARAAVGSGNEERARQYLQMARSYDRFGQTSETAAKAALVAKRRLSK